MAGRRRRCSRTWRESEAAPPSCSICVNRRQARPGEIVNGDEVGIRADVTLDASGTTGDAAVTAAAAFVKGGPRPSAAATASAPPARLAWRPDRAYAETPYPSAEHRVLGVYRLWGVVNYFFPYRHLMTRDWDTALTRYLPRAIAAKDALEYGLVIAEMATWLEDSHVSVGSTALQPFYGEAIPPLTLRYVENVPVVIGFRDEAVARAAGVQ